MDAQIIDELIAVLAEVRDLPTVVEGRNDKRALERIGFTNVIEIAGPLFRVVEQLEGHKEVAILTDLDDAGKELYHYFSDELSRRGVKINNKARIALFKTGLRQIEGLTKFLERQRGS